MHLHNTSPSRFIHHLTLGVTGGLLGGTLVGLVESVVVLASKTPVAGDSFIYFYSSILFGLIGIVLGGGCGILLAILTTLAGRTIERVRSFALPFTTVLVLEGLVIARFRILRDVFEQRLRLLEPTGIAVHLALVVGAVLLFFVVYRFVLIPLVKRKPLAILGNLFGGLFLYGIVLLATFLLWNTSTPEETMLKARLPLPPAPAEEQDRKPHILLIVLDTLRADHLSCYGYRTISTPNIDAFAYDGVLFQNMFTQSSWTKPSFATILSSTYPSTHQAIGKPDMFSAHNLTLPEVLYENGYYTVGITNNVNVSEVFNFHQGFVEFTYLEPDFFFFANEAASKLNFYDVLRKVREKFLVKKKVEHYYQDATVVNRTFSFSRTRRHPS